MSNNILVTGGAGFIGSHIVDALVKKGHSIRILDNFEPQVHQQVPEYINTSAEVMKGDVRSYDDLQKAIEGIDIIYHEAAMVGVGQSMYQVDKYIDVNTYGTAKLLDFLVNKEHSVQKLIVASSMSIYGEGAYRCDDHGEVYPDLRTEDQMRSRQWEVRCPYCNKEVTPIPTPENKPLHPTSIYAISKKDQEEMCLAIGRSYGLPTVALRYFNAFGPRQALSNPYTGVCAIFSARIKNDNPPVVFEDGCQTRDFISVYDIAQANVLAMEKSNADYKVFNVGTGTPISIKDIAEVLSDLYKKKIHPEITQKYRAGDIRHCYGDISKIRGTLGFKPSVDFREGMADLVAWGEKQEAHDGFSRAYEELLQRGLVEK